MSADLNIMIPMHIFRRENVWSVPKVSANANSIISRREAVGQLDTIVFDS